MESSVGATVTVRELGGEIWAELHMRKTLAQLPVASLHEVVDLLTALLARHVGAVIENDRDMPVAPLPRVAFEEVP